MHRNCAYEVQSYELDDTVQGPEIRTGFLKDGQPIKLTTGKEITITTDYEAKGHEDLIAMRYITQTVKIFTHAKEPAQ